MAATLKEGADQADNTWSEFALVARDLDGEAFLDEIPLARRIAAATAKAFEQALYGAAERLCPADYNGLDQSTSQPPYWRVMLSRGVPA